MTVTEGPVNAEWLWIEECITCIYLECKSELIIQIYNGLKNELLSRQTDFDPRSSLGELRELKVVKH